jgi:hypothetical protein
LNTEKKIKNKKAAKLVPAKAVCKVYAQKKPFLICFIWFFFELATGFNFFFWQRP